MRLTLRRFALMALVAGVLLPQAALADFPKQAVYLGIYGGGHFRLRQWDMGDSLKGYPDDRAAGTVGMRLGFHVLSQLAFELEVGYIPWNHKDSLNHMLTYNLDILVHLIKGNWAPVIEAGVGGYANLDGSLGKDNDPRAHIGIGVRGLVLPWMAFRLDVRDIFSDGLDKWGANNLEATVGLDFFLWRASAAKPKPLDRDHDGILDADDACPDNPGPVALQGCPDRDKDGIIDKNDKCPDQPGPAATKGCPDKDGDGVLDSEDACPDQPGPAALKGCPDKDGDGIADKDDRCPDVAGPKNLQGCPDKDGDGIVDIDDKCPDVAGLKEYQGCLPAKAAKFTGSIKGINFATGSAKILAGSFKVLDGAVAVLKEFQSMRLRIEGHTDNVGSPEMNQKLSEDRAASVREYLVKKGIAEDRLESVGYGLTKPVQDNATSAGRAANRRIEFTVIAGK